MRATKAAIEAIEASKELKRNLKDGTGPLAVARFRHLAEAKKLEILEDYIEGKGEVNWAISLFFPVAKAMLSQNRAEIRKYCIQAAGVAIAWAGSIDKEENNNGK